MRGEEEATRASIGGKEEDEARAEEARGAKRKRSEEAAGTRARARCLSRAFVNARASVSSAAFSPPRAMELFSPNRSETFRDPPGLGGIGRVTADRSRARLYSNDGLIDGSTRAPDLEKIFECGNLRVKGSDWTDGEIAFWRKNQTGAHTISADEIL